MLFVNLQPGRVQSRLFFIVKTLLVIAAAVGAGGAQTNKAAYDSILTGYYVDACCKSTIAACLEKKTDCAIAPRLRAFTEWIVDFEKDPVKIKEQLDLRYSFFVSTETVKIDTARLLWAGDPASPVTVVAYMSANCGLCKLSVGTLYDSITAGSLKGKVRLLPKPFGKGPGDRALVAAMTAGKFWDLFSRFRQTNRPLSEEDCLRLADSAGIGSQVLSRLLKNKAVDSLHLAIRAEGEKFGITVTPTFFVDNKRYASYKNPRWVLDAVSYEYEMKRR